MALKMPPKILSFPDRPILGRVSRLVNFIYRKHPWIYHLGFWAAYFFLSAVILSELLEFSQAMLRSTVIISLQAMLVYSNFWLLDRFLFRNNLSGYIITLPMVWLAFGIFRTIIETKVLERDLLGVKPLSSQHIAVVFISSFLILVVSSFVRFVDDWYIKRMEAQALETARLEAELRFLQSQVNPHFLFNVLNMIYTQAYTGSDQTAPTVLKLSEMMRYMLEATRKKKVKLKEEIDYLENFIGMQTLKKGRSQNVEFVVIGNPESLDLEPMLFIPFLENAYKHGDISLNDAGWVKAELTIGEKKIIFEVKNSLGSIPQKKDKTSGVGLENIRQRLDLLFPGQYDLRIDKKPDEFSIRLLLTLKQ